MQRFIDSLKDGKLVSSRCLSCKKPVWPPSHVCPLCLGDEIEWVEMDKRGRLLEYSESFLTAQPSVFGLVEFADGVRLVAKIHCRGISQLKRGMAVEVVRCGISEDKKNEPYFEFQPI